MIGIRPLVVQRNLQILASSQLFHAPSSLVHHTPGARGLLGVHEDHHVALFVDPGFIQLRRVQNDPEYRRVVLQGRHDRLSTAVEPRVEQSFQALQLMGVIEDDPGDRPPIRSTLRRANLMPPPLPQNIKHFGSLQLLVGHAVRIQNHATAGFEDARYLRLTGANPAGQPNDRFLACRLNRGQIPARQPLTASIAPGENSSRRTRFQPARPDRFQPAIPQ